MDGFLTEDPLMSGTPHHQEDSLGIGFPHELALRLKKLFVRFVSVQGSQHGMGEIPRQEGLTLLPPAAKEPDSLVSEAQMGRNRGSPVCIQSVVVWPVQLCQPGCFPSSSWPVAGNSEGNA